MPRGRGFTAGSTGSGPQIVLIGATLTGNRGAEAMLQAAVQRIPELVADARFTLLSLYAADDRAENRDPKLRIVPFSPAHMLAVAFPLALVAGLLRKLHLPFRWLLPGSMRAMARADLVIDLSGISFVDGRGAIVAYNALLVLLPVLVGTPLLKYSQAMGPFRGWLNRTCARWLLPKVARIAARGTQTRAHLAELGLPAQKIRDCADAAFALRVGPAAAADIAPLLSAPVFQRPVVAVSASSVVDRLCGRQGVDYVARMAEFIRHLIDEKGYGVCLLAHSARPGRQSEKNNDLPVCGRIAAAVRQAGPPAAGPAECLFVERALNAEALRALIAACRFLVAARFHAMISGLATGVPTMQVGWSHKYAEVLEMFGLTAYAVDYARLTAGGLREMFARLEREADAVRAQIAAHLPAVLESSLGNARLAAELLSGENKAPALASTDTKLELCPPRDKTKPELCPARRAERGGA